MQKSFDTIQFESREEIRNIAIALNEYIKNHGKSSETADIRRLFDLLDIMDMEW